MQPLRLGRWGSSILPLGNRQSCQHLQCPRVYSIRFQSSASLRPTQDAEPAKRKRGRPQKGETSSNRPRRRDSVAAATPATPSSQPPPPPPPPSSTAQETARSIADQFTSSGIPPPPGAPPPPPPPEQPPSSTYASARTGASNPPTPSNKSQSTSTRDLNLQILPSPPPIRARKSPKLSALHSRLNLPKSLPLETLARALVDKTADPDPRFNNHTLSVLGNDLLGYYTIEHFVCLYPRLPQVVLEAAVYAHAGPKALSSIATGWGIDPAAEPGGEVDPGLLQFRRSLPTRREYKTATGITEFAQERTGAFNPAMMTQEHAAAAAVRAIMACVYLHEGADRVKEFFKDHVLSRHLDLHSLFTFYQPTRDLSRLCARQGFESPIARIISETGRLSSAPVFVVGVYSGFSCLGEDAGASLDEARWKAAAKALKGWYLYSPKNEDGSEVMVPSLMEGRSGKDRTWRKAHVDMGEVVV